MKKDTLFFNRKKDGAILSLNHASMTSDDYQKLFDSMGSDAYCVTLDKQQDDIFFLEDYEFNGVQITLIRLPSTTKEELDIVKHKLRNIRDVVRFKTLIIKKIVNIKS